MPLIFLNFPYLAMKNLVDQMSKTDLVRVSLQSHRADMALKDCGKNNVSFYNLDREELRQLSEFDRAELFLLEAARQGALPKWRIELSATVSEEISFRLSSPYFINNFEFSIAFDFFKNIDSHSGVRKNLMIGDYHFFSEAYGLPVSSLEIHVCENLDHSTNLERIVCASSQLDIRQVSVFSDPESEYFFEDDYSFIMENIKVNGVFEGMCETSDSFQFNKKINAESITICPSQWFTIEHLLSSRDYKEIRVENSEFTKDEVQMFLRQWKAGEFPNLKSLWLETSMKNPLDALEGFERHERHGRPRGVSVNPLKIFNPYIKGYGEYCGRIQDLFSAFVMDVYRVGEYPDTDSDDEEDEEEEDEEEDEGGEGEEQDDEEEEEDNSDN